ncbi:MAG: HEAT repeat domain-containing protein [Candidatus Heimdallarchaeota archaeon]
MVEVKLIIKQLADANDKETKVKLISQLGSLGDEDAIRILIRSLNHEEDIEIKSHAADALTKIGGKQTTFLLLRSLKNHSWVTRMKAAEILGELHSRLALLPLVKLLKNDPETSVREWSVISLGKIGDKKAVKPLITALAKDPNWEVRMESAIALGSIGGKKAKNSLIKAFYSDSVYRVSWASASALAMINDGNSKKLIKELTSELTKILQTEKDETVLSAAAKTLGEIGNEIAAKTMLITMKVSKELVRLEINLALGRMAKRFNYKNKEEFIKNIQVNN